MDARRLVKNFFDWAFAREILPRLLDASLTTIGIALAGFAIAVVLGALFYGLNNTGVNQASTDQGARTPQTQPANPAAPPGMRDVTPKANTQPGVTTGSAPAHPTAPQSAPKGTEIDRSANPPTNSNDNK